jgi:putative queuosine salvage protein
VALVDDIRAGCKRVAAHARHVTIDTAAIGLYARALKPAAAPAALDGVPAGDREARAAFVLALDAINFGSGWFPTLRRRAGLSGYRTVEAGLRERAARDGPWTAENLAQIDAAAIAAVLGQDPGHELMGLYAAALRELGARVADEHGGRFAALADAGGRSAVALATELAAWPTFADVSEHRGSPVPLWKRAQIVPADLALAGVTAFDDLDRLTLFADNLVPHVLRLDGVLRFAPALVAQIDRGELLEHGGEPEVEIRACALHAVELIVAARGDDLPAHAVDRILWNRGAEPRYKARPRHRARCTAY